MNKLIFKKSFFTVISICITMSLFYCTEPKPDAEIKLDVSQISRTMSGGIGASWHSISKEMHELPGYNQEYKYPLLYPVNRGSAFGGNPPASDSSAWNQIKQYASWLGLNFLRVELSHRMYEPEQGKFDWDNEEMQALYHILDWCQQNDADVFLTQMWGFVEWNAYPDVHPLISAPKNLDAFANGIASLLEYLVNEKDYTCIKYFCMTNEPPGGTWGYWWEYGDYAEGNSIDDAWKKLKEVFDQRGITVPISGPDWTTMPPFDEEKLTFASYLGSIDIHRYGFELGDGINEHDEATLKKWADWAHESQKPFFLSELGNLHTGRSNDNPGQNSFEAALLNANDIFRALRAGVDGVNRWSYTNRGDLDGQWQLIKTWDSEKKEYLRKVETENEAFYGFGILARFFSKYSSVVECTVNKPDSILMSVALLSPEGELSVFVLNPSDNALNVALNITSLPEKQMNVYQVTKEMVSQPDFELNVIQQFKSSKKNSLTLPAKSITTISSYFLKHNDNGIILQ